MDIEQEELERDDQLDWRIPYLQCLVDGTLPSDPTDAWRLAHHTKTFVLIDGEMYKCNPSGILLRCITVHEGRGLLRKIHLGACEHHAAPQTLVENAFRQGFYWPTTVANAIEIV
jgi:hypothetical protein